jgi:N6-adenosine-specific RNA methylase IME4
MSNGIAPLPAGPFQIVVADPPWNYNFSRSKRRRIENQYRTMKLDDIAALCVSRICAPDAVLYLWATAPKLEQAFQIGRAWGFTYVTHGAWDKRRTEKDLGAGYWFRSVHEDVLVFKLGDHSPPPEHERIASIQREPRTQKHSKKPGWLQDHIDAAFPSERKVELFAREPRPGWSVWGDEVLPMEWKR